ncbi:mitochondrial 37S ribosomal protein uS17m MRPS17 [Sporobolomyces salmoneus]|uniref:mitochondrial 37S ribosomal protein uS17m MRPS17 n=1 Tax=Sporobolomyces salmoneus TaxID=183962 RepID=UPI00316F3628
MSLRTVLQPFKSTLRPCTCPHSSIRFSSTVSSPLSNLPPPASPWTLPKGLELVGNVVKHGKMKQTITVSVERRMTDHKTLKEFKKHSTYLVHDPESSCVVGDQVKIRNCRPISARKRFELVQVVKGARERAESKEGPGIIEDSQTTDNAQATTTA